MVDREWSLLFEDEGELELGRSRLREKPGKAASTEGRDEHVHELAWKVDGASSSTWW